MDDTGERLIPESADPDLRNEHVARYRFAEPLAAGARVLDAGCGTGYGAALLAKRAAFVCAMDRSREATRNGRDAYPEVWFARGDCARLPFPDGQFDLVVGFEVIEHLEDWSGFVAETARVLAPSGTVVLSTPNRSYYNAARETPNPFHVHEFDPDEFRSALEACFRHCSFYLENHVAAVAVTGEGGPPVRTVAESVPSDPEHAHFLIAACSKQEAEPPPGIIYLPSAGNILREREQHIRKMKDWIGILEARHAAVEAGLSAELSRLPYRMLRALGLAPKLPATWRDPPGDS